MSPKDWGPPIWIFLHTLAEKVKEEKYPVIGQQIINFIIQICLNLPCNTCAEHARRFVSKIEKHKLKTKRDLKNLLYIFHNTVNKRKQLSDFKYEDLEKYKQVNFIQSYNNFARVFNTKGNMKLISESFYRSRVLKDIKNWLMANISNFDM